MTATKSAVKGRTAQLEDGSTVVLWIEQDPETITILITDEDNQNVSHLQARRRGRPAAELTILTEPFMRRRGLAKLAFADVIAWAQQRRVPFLVGDLPPSEPGAKAILLGSGHPIAFRSSAGSTRFALLVPAGAPEASDARAVALERAEAALEAGASLNEAEALYDRLVTAA